jgi:hypothetical protein
VGTAVGLRADGQAEVQLLPSHPACADSRQGSTEYQCR